MNPISGTSSFTSKLRLTGLSGLDTESIIEQLMQVERLPLDTLKQRKTLVQWKQEAYRSVSTSLMGFKSKFFDIVNRSSYLLSENSIKVKTVKTSSSEYLTATAAANANLGSQNVKVVQVAEAARSVSAGKVSKAITGTIENTQLADKNILVTLDGVSKEITLENYASETELATKLQDALNKAFGSGKVQVNLTLNEDLNKYQFTLDTANGATKVTLNEASGSSGVLENLGLNNGVSNRINIKGTLASLEDSLNIPLTKDADGNYSFTINNKTFSFSETDSLQKVFDTINNSAEANVTISYDEITDKITLAAKQTGTGDTLKLEDLDGSNLLAALGLGSITAGKDAVVQIDGETIVRSSNNFTVNGITYSLKKAHAASSTGETLTVEQDIDSVVNNIKTFVEEYNKLIDSINGLVNEKYDRNYLPLTDAQKEAMKEDDIEKWEKKAKTGILRNDSILQQITLAMRKALYEKVEGVNISLKDIGIESKSYSDNGKLYLDEDKLRNALTNNPDEVTKLLNGTSSQYPTYSRDFTSEEKQAYHKQSGVLRRLASIIEDNISTVRNAKGYKGTLLEKAGIENDLTNTKNLLSYELEDYDDRIDDLVAKLAKKEESYYSKFSALETMLNKMNQQSSWILSQFGGGA
jgi:flagellar hook-associated protein 2